MRVHVGSGVSTLGLQFHQGCGAGAINPTPLETAGYTVQLFQKSQATDLVWEHLPSASFLSKLREETNIIDNNESSTFLGITPAINPTMQLTCALSLSCSFVLQGGSAGTAIFDLKIYVCRLKKAQHLNSVHH